MRVVITGAAGGIGRQLIDELSGSHELCLIDCKPVLAIKQLLPTSLNVTPMSDSGDGSG